MSSKRLSAKKIEAKISALPSKEMLAEHFGLSRFYEQAVFCPDYCAPENFADIVHLTDEGKQLIESCVKHTNVRPQAAALAIYGYFFHHDLLIDYERTNISQIALTLEADLLNDRIRFPYIWGRTLHDKYNDKPPSEEPERLTNAQAWSFLEGTPIGVFQHGVFLSGPLGIIRSEESRWIPLAMVFEDCFLREGTVTKRARIRFSPPKVDVVTAYAWIETTLIDNSGIRSSWAEVLPWIGNRQCTEARTDYADICTAIADCIFKDERSLLLENALKTEAGKSIREAVRNIGAVRGLKSLPPSELARRLDGEQQLQLMMSLQTDALVTCIDSAILSGQISIPTSEIRIPKKSPPSKNKCFSSEVSSLDSNLVPFARETQEF